MNLIMKYFVRSHYKCPEFLHLSKSKDFRAHYATICPSSFHTYIHTMIVVSKETDRSHLTPTSRQGGWSILPKDKMSWTDQRSSWQPSDHITAQTPTLWTIISHFTEMKTFTMSIMNNCGQDASIHVALFTSQTLFLQEQKGIFMAPLSAELNLGEHAISLNPFHSSY